MSIFSYLPICSLLVVRAGLHMETEVQIDLHATHPSANKMVRYSCSSGLGDVVLVSPLGLRPVSRCRGDFFLSPGLPAAPGGDPRVHSTMLSRRRHLVRLSPLPCPARPGFLLLMGSQLRRQMDLQTQ